MPLIHEWWALTVAAARGTLTRNWWRRCVTTLTPFPTRYHTMTPFFNNSRPISDNLSPSDTFLTTFCQKFFFCFLCFFFNCYQNMCPNLYFSCKIVQNLSNSHRLTPFFCLLIEWPLFGEKSLTKRHLVSSAVRTPRHF